MKSEIISILLIGMSKEKTDILCDIFNDQEYYISSLCKNRNLLQANDFTKADCLIIDSEIWCNDSFNIKDSNVNKIGASIPVIIAGNDLDGHMVKESFNKGADDYIAFPFRKHEVLARLNNQILLSRTKRSLIDEADKKTSDLTRSNKLLNESVEEYKMILKELHDNETLFLAIALNIPNSYLAIVERNYSIGFAAGTAFKKNNINPWELVGLPIEKIFKEHAGFVKNNLMNSFEGKEISFELEFKNQYLQYKSVPLFTPEGTVFRILVVAENITERKLSEKSIQESLREKETLLKEIHHRVKNNMQLVCSMINLQAEGIENSVVVGMFKTLQSRIYSMSLVHEKLYQHKQFSKINFSDYIKQLVAEISNSFSCENQKNIRFELELQDENFTIDKAIPCGLILNELILNSFKHALHTTEDGFIRIVFEKKDIDSYRLTVSDNGIGLPAGFDINRAESMGMMLVRELVSQLKGEIFVQSGMGATFVIDFGHSLLNVKPHTRVVSSNGKKNIMIVEDERIILQMLRKIIEGLGYNIVDAVSSGREAIRSAVKYTPDLIIMDIMLEDEINGVEAAAAIIKEHRCPIVFLTGNSDPATLKSARSINPFEMLTKPVQKLHLVDVIESALK